MHALTLFVMVAALVGGAWSQDTPEAARNDAREALRNRLKGIGIGDYLLEKAGEPAIGPEDVSVVLVGLRSAEAEIAESAVRAVGVLAHRHFFADLHPAVALDIVENLLDRVGRDGEGPAVSALVIIEQETPQWMDAYREKAVGRAEARLGDPDPDDRRRAALLIGGLGPRLGMDRRARCTERILDVLEGPLAAAQGGESAHVAEGFMLRALARMAVSETALAERAAHLILQRLGTMTRVPGHLPRTIYGGLARFGVQGGETVREKIFERLLADLAEEDLVYTVTSGRRTPMRHPCSDALIKLEPALSLEQIHRAIAVFQNALERATAAGWEAMDIESLYGERLRQLRARAARGR